VVERCDHTHGSESGGSHAIEKDYQEVRMGARQRAEEDWLALAFLDLVNDPDNRKISGLRKMKVAEMRSILKRLKREWSEWERFDAGKIDGPESLDLLASWIIKNCPELMAPAPTPRKRQRSRSKVQPAGGCLLLVLFLTGGTFLACRTAHEFVSTLLSYSYYSLLTTRSPSLELHFKNTANYELSSETLKDTD
jgi:hypothetical protein